MKENMELRCVQTKMYVILKKIIYTHYFDFERASREGPAGPDGPPPLICIEYSMLQLKLRSAVEMTMYLEVSPLLSNGTLMC